MILRPLISAIAGVLFLLEGCTHNGLRQTLRGPASPPAPPSKMLAVYEPWFGHPRHMDIGYSSQDPLVIRKQIEQAKRLGITGFVVDWYGDREPFLDKSYALVQAIAAQQSFNVAAMYDETDKDAEAATDDALVSFEKLRTTYLGPKARGRDAYL